jgi:glycosyltransferase involved in cell wall biosynthesis
MNICLLSTSTLVHQMGGTEVHCNTLLEKILQKNHTIHLITTSHPNNIEEETGIGYRVYYLADTHYSMSRKWAKKWWVESSKKIAELNKKEAIDIIIAENMTGQYYAKNIKPLLKIPIISIDNGMGIKGEIRSVWNKTTSPYDYLYFFLKYIPQTILFFIPWFSSMIKYSNKLICVSDEGKNEIINEFKIPSEKVEIIYNSIDTEKFKPDKNSAITLRNKYSLKKSDKTIIMVGVLQKQKGFHIGIKAFHKIKKEISNVKLLIVGNGPEFKNLKKLTEKLNLTSDIIFTGQIKNDNLPLYHNMADIFLNPTLRYEGLAITTIEALACGLPSVISKIGGTQSTIEDGKSGFFTKAGDINNLTEKTIFLLKNPKKMKEFGKNARKLALEKFNLENMISKYDKIIKEVSE